MGKNMDLNGLNHQECAQIHQVIQRDSILRTREQQRLSKIEDELNSEAAKRITLTNQKSFNDKYCILCCSAFNFLFNKKLICEVCKFNLCRNCAFFEDKHWICKVCEKQRSLYLQSCKWQCNKDAKNQSNVHFGSAKLFEGFVNHNKIYKSAKSDSFDDSIVSSNMNGNSDLSQTNGEEKHLEPLHNSGQSRDSPQSLEDSTLIEVREHIEAMVEGILGESLDSAHVDKPYDHIQYDEFLNNHREKLSHALLDLTQALYLTMTNKPTINNPTNAHVTLKDLIIKITEDSYRLPYLTKKSSSDSAEETLNHLHNFSSYEELLATAIINQLVEVHQSGYQKDINGSNGSENSKSAKHSEISIESDLTDSESVMSYNDPTVIITSSNFGSRHSLVENFISQEPAYVLQEQIEEITTTKSYSDAEDMSHNEESMYPDLNLNITQTPLKVPFPEAGLDIVDVNILSSGLTDEELSEDSGIKLTDLQNWEENWLFKKNKKADIKSDIMYGYMALTMAECPVAMLIPNPSQKINASIGDREIDELSDLSEHNSVGSLEFSDDESEEEDHFNQNEVELTLNEVNDYKALDSQLKTKVSTSKSSEVNAAKTKFARNRNKPIVQFSTKVPNFLPIELRTSNVDSNSDPCFVLRPGDASVQSGIIVQFCCKAKGTKPVLYSWFKNDTLLKSDNNIRIFDSGEENILEIKKTTVEDSAQYSCVVYNHLGSQWCDFNFKVRDSSFLSNNINKRTRKQNFAVKSKHEIKVASSKSTNVSKHDNIPSTPLVIQRTWAERVAELKKSNSDSKDNEEMPSKRGKNDEQNDQQSDKLNETITVEIPTLRSGTIAEREHKKWESPDIEWKDNPYTPENINTRIQQRALISSLGNESPEIKEENNDEDQDSSFLSYNAKDLSRYKREYYIPETLNKDEPLRSYDENEYSNSKYFDINLTKPNPQDETDSKVNNKLSEDKSESDEVFTAKNPIEIEAHSSDSESFLPSVKDLVSKFSVNSAQNDETQKLDNIQRQNSFSNENISNLPKKTPPRMAQISQSNFKVHSLTARSMSKEFRELSNINIPRTQNRIAINGNNSALTQLESEPSSPSTACSPTNEGYASDESNTSSVISNNGNLSVAIQPNKTNNGRKFSRSILKRASYWEKRCEQGLISDSSVGEDFPPIESNVED